MELEGPNDVLVVGAGPGGLAAANRAADLGLRVAILEKQRDIGYPIRTSGGTFVADMEELGVPSKFYHPIRSLVFGTVHDQIRIDYPADRACVLDTRSAYQHLAVKAAKKGARLYLNATAVGALQESGQVVGVRTQWMDAFCDARAKVVIDGSGQACTIGRNCGLVAPSWARIGTGVEYEAFVERLEPAVSALIVGDGVAPGGYAWIFPTSATTARIGVGLLRPESQASPIQFLRRLLDHPPKLVSELGRIVPFEEHGGIIPVESPPNVPAMNGLILVGDSACQANPVVGEGIRPAMRFGQLAAEVAHDAINLNDVSLRAFRRYIHGWDQYRRSHERALELNRRMATYDDKRWSRALQTLRLLSQDEWFTFLRGELSLAFILGLVLKHPRMLTSRTVSSLAKGPE